MLQAQFNEQSESLAKQIYESTGETFNILSPKQLGEVMEKFPHRVLYNALGRPYFSLRVQKGESPLVLLRDVVTLLPGAQNQPQTKP